MTRALLFACLASLSAAVTAQAPSYFPLGLGDSRTYAYEFWSSSGDLDVQVDDPLEVTQTVTVNDTVYTEVDYPFAFGVLHRTDAEGRVWVRTDDVDRLLFDVTLEDGGTYTFPEPGSEFVYHVTVHRDETASTFTESFEDAVSFVFDIPGWIDDVRGFTLAPGVGVVVAGADMFGTYRLYAASVGGRVYTGVGAAGPEPERLGTAAPNPFAASTTIRLPAGPAPAARVEVVDLLGRRIAVLHDGPVGPGGRDVTWAASGVPSGVYLARILRGGRVQTLRLVKG